MAAPNPDPDPDPEPGPGPGPGPGPCLLFKFKFKDETLGFTFKGETGRSIENLSFALGVGEG